MFLHKDIDEIGDLSSNDADEAITVDGVCPIIDFLI